MVKSHFLRLVWVCAALNGDFVHADGMSRRGEPPNFCGVIYEVNAYGPYDYRFDKDKLPIVENAHFTPKVEQLIAGQSGTWLAGDIDYTLRKFPNHHRALLAMSRYSLKVKSDQPKNAGFPVECYFERALRFKPDDVVARMLYANFLLERSRVDDALAQLQICIGLADENAISHYNIGLIYFDAKRQDLALSQAHKAMALGLNWPGLKDKLVKAGAWTEPTAAKAAPAAESPASAHSAVPTAPASAP